jgi:hypothetical protein
LRGRVEEKDGMKMEIEKNKDGMGNVMKIRERKRG